jgi:hypothetical protein
MLRILSAMPSLVYMHYTLVDQCRQVKVQRVHTRVQQHLYCARMIYNAWPSSLELPSIDDVPWFSYRELLLEKMAIASIFAIEQSFVSLSLITEVTACAGVTNEQFSSKNSFRLGFLVMMVVVFSSLFCVVGSLIGWFSHRAHVHRNQVSNQLGTSIFSLLRAILGLILLSLCSPITLCTCTLA